MVLTGADRYNPSKVSELEKHVEEQVSSNTYHLDSNLALLRFYQFNPSLVNSRVLAKVLLKAMTQLPNPDFKMCVHLVPAWLQADELIAPVITLGRHLETTNFPEFWAVTTNTRDLLNTVPGFYESTRGYIQQMLSMSFAHLSRSQLAESLMMDGAALDQLISKRVADSGWKLVKGEKGDTILFPKNDGQMSKKRPTQEMIKFDHVSAVLRTVTYGL